MKDLEDAQQAIVCIIYRSHSSDSSRLKQRTSQDPKNAEMKKRKRLKDPILNSYHNRHKPHPATGLDAIKDQKDYWAH